MNLTTLQTRLRERLGNPDTTDVPDATLTLRLNEALTDIQDNYNFNATKTTDTSLTTVASQQNYTIPTTIDIITSVRDNTNGVKLTKRDRIWWDERAATANLVDAKPTDYFRDGATLYLYPPPDDVYTLRVRGRITTTELSAGGDTPVIPSSWHHGIVLLARAKHWDAIGDGAKYSRDLQVWKNWVMNKADEVAEEIKADYDQAVQLPDLARFGGTSRLDFDHED